MSAQNIHRRNVKVVYDDDVSVVVGIKGNVAIAVTMIYEMGNNERCKHCIVRGCDLTLPAARK